MPIVAEASLKIIANNDGTVDILTIVADEVRKCGCANLASIPEQHNVTLEQVRAAARQLAGDAEIVCDDNSMFCCTDDGRLTEFMETMKKFRGAE